ncbi:MAG: replication-associated recombination protein A [Armatimonadota bacterium]
MNETTDRGGLFSSKDAGAPLAARMRPTSFEEMVGQQHLVAPDSMLRRAVEQDRLPSILLIGPAGSGKSTLALIIANCTRKRFVRMSAVSSGVADIREAAADAQEARDFHDSGTILFIDEIHRLAKNQQDGLLPHVEEGTFTLIGATTENPFYTIISPLRSRCQMYTLDRLEELELNVLLNRALEDENAGLGQYDLQINDDARQHLLDGSQGDARKLLGALELAAQTAVDEGADTITLSHIEQALQQPVLKYDRAGDEHYDTISAFIKSMRGSDPDAAIYWLAKMLEAGEDPEFIARRMIIQAAEDVGLADPTALRVATAAADAVKYVGMPEAQIPLAMAALHLSCAPKSNSAYRAIKEARDDVRAEGAAQVPSHLAGGERVEDDGSEYVYPHEAGEAARDQAYLPQHLQGRRYYRPKDNPREQRIAQWLRQVRGEQDDEADDGDRTPERG